MNDAYSLRSLGVHPVSATASKRESLRATFLGLMPSACIGPQKGYVEAAHGSAPDIANQNKANPYSMIGSVAFLFEKCMNLHQESEDIWNALFAVFEKGYRTVELAPAGYDSSKILTTREFGDLVVEMI